MTGDGSNGSAPVFSVRGRHLRGLDGLRALAVLGVVAYHFQIHWLSGGYLGVDLFFVLSGFLITSLIVEERVSTGRLGLGAFWGRRAKRLLPAMFAMLLVTVAAVSLMSRLRVRGAFLLPGNAMRGDALSTLAYVANWHLIAQHQSYFSQVLVPSPLEHTWSLAIEEQFYIVFPFVALGLVAWFKRRQQLAVGVLLVGACASLLAMAVLYHPGIDPTRIYFGTDTRAFDLLIGAALAFACSGRPVISERWGRPLEVIVFPLGLMLGWFWLTSGTPNEMPKAFMYRGGFAICSLLAAAIIFVIVQRPDSLATRILSLRPMVAIGLVSYGIYLWHWPVIVLINPVSLGHGRLVTDGVRITVIAALVIGSYFLLERPFRRMSYNRRSAVGWISTSIAGTAAAILLLTMPSVWQPWSGPFPSITPVTIRSSNDLIPGSGNIEGASPIRINHPITQFSPLRVSFIGDSLMQLAYPGVASALESTGLVATSSGAVPGWGLTVSGFHPWKQLRQLLRYDHPDLVIGTWTWDNKTATTHPAAYRRKLAEMISLLTTGPNAASGVILLPFPTSQAPPSPFMTGPAGFGSEFDARAWNRLAKTLLPVFPNRLSIWPVNRSVELPRGEYSTWLPPGRNLRAPYANWVRTRRTDGVHLCQNGTVRFATAILTDLQLTYGLGPTRTKWWEEPWTRGPAYGYFPILNSTCPGDNPPPGTSLVRPAPPTG